jgi:hypothetical protein
MRTQQLRAVAVGTNIDAAAVGKLEAFNAEAELERKTAKDAAESTGAHKSAHSDRLQ